MATLFYSYSHIDENLRDQLETHLAALQRQGIISSWHDRRIAPGTDLKEAIDSHIDTSDVILLLISPNFIASDYCYEREMKRALERHASGETTVIPVILRPCDWQDLPFGSLLATPRDGLPITVWPNADEAFLDVVKAVKRAVTEIDPTTKQISGPSVQPVRSPHQKLVRSGNLGVKKKFTDLDKDRFRHDGFEYITKFFQNSLEELVRRNSSLQEAFRRIDANRFTAAVYQEGEKICRASVSIGEGGIGSESIQYSMTDEPRHGGMNEALYVKTDDEAIYFEPLGMQTFGHGKEKLAFEGAAELFWDIFIRPLQS